MRTSRTGWAVVAAVFCMAVSSSTMFARAESTAPTEAQRRECERNGGYWSTAAGMCRIGAKDPIKPDEGPFLAENDAAMQKMMAAMAIVPSGDADRDFVAMMVPHHQGAIDMAQAELRHGRNEHLRRIAQEIVVEQLQQIAAMRLAIQ